MTLQDWPEALVGGSNEPTRIAIVLPGLHRVLRGAEVAFESVARELARIDGVQVTLFGSGKPREGEPYAFTHVGNIPRERFEGWPGIPVLRNAYAYEELTFLPGLLRRYRPLGFDVSVTCGYPFTNWALRSLGPKRGRPAHVFVTQNGDYPARIDQAEYRWFACDGLVCTNPEYYERNKDRWFAALIPNGVDPCLFKPGDVDRAEYGLPEAVPLALMVSALIESKRVADGIRAVAELQGLHLVVCGDGPERQRVERLGRELLANRFHWRRLPRERMPGVYRASDLFLHMSLDEPSANAYMEALATGLPIVTHDRAVTRWTLEDAAVLIDATDRGAVVGGIREALAWRTEAAIRKRRDLVERRFAWSAIARSYLAFLQEARARRARESTG
jgi:glycosyltransferase involved in cell wall biosynthesis